MFQNEKERLLAQWGEKKQTVPISRGFGKVKLSLA